jgi:hypothetical protein
MKIMAGIDRTGDVIFGWKCDECGVIHDLGIMSPEEVLNLIGSLQALLAIGARVKSLPLPWVCDIGNA